MCYGADGGNGGFVMDLPRKVAIIIQYKFCEGTKQWQKSRRQKRRGRNKITSSTGLGRIKCPVERVAYPPLDAGQLGRT